MHSALTVVIWLLAVLLLVCVLLWVYVNVRARGLDSHVGSFRCWARADTHSGWSSGIAHYGVETLSWYRLVAFSTKPVFTLARRDLRVSTPNRRAVDGSIVEVQVQAGEERWEFAISPASYNGLVSWTESGPPTGTNH